MRQPSGLSFVFALCEWGRKRVSLTPGEVRMRRMRACFGMLGAAALALAGAGWGGDSSPLGLVQKAGAETMSAKTAKVSLAITGSGPGGTNVTQTGTGVTDFTKHAET